MTFQVQFLRPGVWTEKSDLFATSAEAEAYADHQAASRKPKPEVIAIVEINGDGSQGRIHRLQKL